MASKAQEKFKQDVKERAAEIEKKVSDWTEEDMIKHMSMAADVYRDRKTGNRLGDFSFDPAHRYYWHVEDGNPDKLRFRRKLGWGFATRADAEKAGLIDDRVSDQTVDGHTCVEMSHKSDRAVLLKIPVELYNMNERVKERLKQNRPVLDSEGKEAGITKVHESDTKTVGKRVEQMLTMK